MFCCALACLKGLGTVQSRQLAPTSLSELMTFPGADLLKMLSGSMQEDVPKSLVLLLSLCGSSRVGTSRVIRHGTLVTAWPAVLKLRETGLQTDY